jgi:hypothetical protein
MSTIEAPLTIFTTYGRVYDTLDSMLCQGKNHRIGCHCQELRSLYGSLLFKCNRVACYYHRKGFENSQDRDRHLREHERPFKCPKAACLYGDVGFKSQANLAQHMEESHRNVKLTEIKHPPIQEIDSESLEAVLTEAINAGEAEFVSRFLGSIPQGFADKLYLMALNHSNSAVVEMFLRFGMSPDRVYLWRPSEETEETDHYQIPLICAVRACKLDIVKCLLTWRCDFYHQNSHSEGFRDDLVVDERWIYGVKWALDHALILRSTRRCLETVQVLKDHGYDLSKRGRHISEHIRSSDCQGDEDVINLIEIFMGLPASGDTYNSLLSYVAQYRPSIAVITYLLQKGADVNSRGNSDRTIRGTALYYACTKTSENAAYMTKFLLESGADPALKVGGRLPGRQRGAKNISKWLGVTWEELVEATSHKRQTRSSS